jgi:hypothetical protein
MRSVNKAAWIGVLVFAGVARASDAPALKPLYDQHRWFELREAIKDQDAPPLYKGTVASAFNDTKAAKKYLSRTIKLEPNSASAEEAHEKLAAPSIAKRFSSLIKL